MQTMDTFLNKLDIKYNTINQNSDRCPLNWHIRDFKMSQLQRQCRLQGDPRFVPRMREVKSQVVTWL